MNALINKYYSSISICLMIIGLFIAIIGPIPDVYKNNIINLSINNMILVIISLSSLLTSVIIFVKFKDFNKDKILPSDSRYLQNIQMLVEEYLQKNQIILPVSKYSKKVNINDLERIAGKVYYPQKKYDEIVDLLESARAYAFTAKYSSPRYDDEKITQAAILGDWKKFFNDILSNLNIKTSIDSLHILNVGIGNGYESNGLFANNKNFIAVDISETALNLCKNIYPEAKYFKNSAENLKDIPNLSIDLYISFRTLQSSLLDRRMAIHEAYRVLKIGGYVIISIPCLFIKEDTGEKFRGLIKDNSSLIDENILNSTVNELKEYLQILRFSNIVIDENSPYEIFISAHKI